MTSILVTNDDGYDAPGILALAEAMRGLGEVRVSAPARNQSGSGHAISLFKDIAYRHCQIGSGIPTLAVGGSPADCIAVAMLGLLEGKPDIVVSGINRGANIGQDLTYSGTVAAALEAAIHGLPAIAMSLAAPQADRVEDYAAAARIALAIAAKVLESGLPPLTILNVNVPGGAPYEDLSGIRLTRQGLRIYRDQLKNVNENLVRVEGQPPVGKVDEVGSDIWALHRGFVSVTPVHLDMTAHQFMATLAAWDLPLS